MYTEQNSKSKGSKPLKREVCTKTQDSIWLELHEIACLEQKTV